MSLRDIDYLMEWRNLMPESMIPPEIKRLKVREVFIQPNQGDHIPDLADWVLELEKQKFLKVRELTDMVAVVACTDVRYRITAFPFNYQFEIDNLQKREDMFMRLSNLSVSTSASYPAQVSEADKSIIIKPSKGRILGALLYGRELQLEHDPKKFILDDGLLCVIHQVPDDFYWHFRVVGRYTDDDFFEGPITDPELIVQMQDCLRAMPLDIIDPQSGLEIKFMEDRGSIIKVIISSDEPYTISRHDGKEHDKEEFMFSIGGTSYWLRNIKRNVKKSED